MFIIRVQSSLIVSNNRRFLFLYQTPFIFRTLYSVKIEATTIKFSFFNLKDFRHFRFCFRNLTSSKKKKKKIKFQHFETFSFLFQKSNFILEINLSVYKSNLQTLSFIRLDITLRIHFYNRNPQNHLVSAIFVNYSNIQLISAVATAQRIRARIHVRVRPWPGIIKTFSSPSG